MTARFLSNKIDHGEIVLRLSLASLSVALKC